MGLSVVFCTEEFDISAGSESLLAISMFSLKLSCLFEVYEVEFEGLLMSPGRFIFFTKFCDRPITLAMVDE